MIDRVGQDCTPIVTMQCLTLDIPFNPRALVAPEMEPPDTGLIISQTSTDAETEAALQKRVGLGWRAGICPDQRIRAATPTI